MVSYQIYLGDCLSLCVVADTDACDISVAHSIL